MRDWVERFNAEGADGLLSRKPPDNPPKLGDAQWAALVRIVERGPIPARDGVVRWRQIDLAAWVWEAFGISVREATTSRELKAFDFGKLSARPRRFSKDFPAHMAAVRETLPPGIEIELWFQDEARIGQKNTITRRWALRGTRPSAPRRATSARRPPVSSGPSAPRQARARGRSCHDATPTP